jgi:hypothetical protein
MRGDRDRVAGFTGTVYARNRRDVKSCVRRLTAVESSGYAEQVRTRDGIIPRRGPPEEQE